MTTTQAAAHAALDEHITAALKKLGDVEPLAGLFVANQLDAGRFRVFARFDVNPDGEIDTYSLHFPVEIDLGGVCWAVFCTPRWSDLGLTEDDVLVELANVQAQQHRGPAA